MKHGTHNRTISATFALLGTLAFAASAGAAVEPSAAVAVSPSPTEQATEELPELDEVLVSGGRLYDRIVKAEDRFFKLYNELNKEDDYDTNCAFVPIDQDSRMEQRFCMPAFFADAKAEQVRLSQYCLSLTAKDEDGNITSQGACYEPPAADAIFFARKEDYVDNVLKIIKSDPRLSEMASEVESLHRERAKLARRYDDIKAEAVLTASRKQKNKPTVR